MFVFLYLNLRISKFFFYNDTSLKGWEGMNNMADYIIPIIGGIIVIVGIVSIMKNKRKK